jgi:hypothetical protein
MKRFVVIGKCKMKGGGIGVVVQPIDADGAYVGPEEVYPAAGRIALKVAVGSIYSVIGTASGIRPATAKFERQWPDNRALLRWQSAARAFDDVQAAIRSEKKAVSRDAMRAQLEPMVAAYRRLNTAAERIAFEVRVLSVLRETRLDREG